MIISKKGISFEGIKVQLPIPPFYGYKRVRCRNTKYHTLYPNTYAILKLFIPEDATIVCVHSLSGGDDGSKPELTNLADGAWQIITPRIKNTVITFDSKVKMRSDKVEVVAAFPGYNGKSSRIKNPEDYVFYSKYDRNFNYVVGKTKTAKLNKTNEQCESGIHFYLHRKTLDL